MVHGPIYFLSRKVSSVASFRVWCVLVGKVILALKLISYIVIRRQIVVHMVKQTMN
jgi:hypothetical protein